MPDAHTMVDTASRMACEAHEGHRRKYTKRPYVEHPQRVAARVAAHPGSTLEMVAAAWLHDVLEDTAVSAEAIEEAVSPGVAALVRELTNPSRGSDLPRAERKAMDREHLARISDEAKVIKMIDRIDNLGELGSAPRPFRALYAMESERLAEAIGDADAVLREELAAAARRYAFGGGPSPGGEE